LKICSKSLTETEIMRKA